jgi:hypothetical protein
MTTEAITPLRQRMIEDMTSRKVVRTANASRIYSCKRSKRRAWLYSRTSAAGLAAWAAH